MATRTTTKKVKQQWVVRDAGQTSDSDVLARNGECEAEWKRIQEAEFKSELPAGATFAWKVNYRDGAEDTKATLTATTREQKAEFALAKVAERFVDLSEDDARARADFQRVFNSDPAHAIGSYSEAVVKVQATLKVWKRIEDVRKVMAEKAIAPVAACQALECYIAELQNDLREELMGSRHWEHRSSSQWRNTVAEIQAVAQADMVRRGGWDRLTLVQSYLARVRGEAL